MAYVQETLITKVTPSRLDTSGWFTRAASFAVVSVFAACFVSAQFFLDMAEYESYLISFGATSVPLLAMYLNRKRKSSRERALVEAEIEGALKAIADDGFKPTKHDYDKLFTYGRSVPFTIHGISGGSLSRTLIANREGPKEYAIHLNVSSVDDGTESFQRLLHNAIASNPDIKIADNAQKRSMV